MKKRSYMFILVGVLFISCIDEIDLNLDSGPTKLVVFGWITNEVKPYKISVKFSNSFESLDPFPAFSGAEVYVLNEASERFDFFEQGESGTYYSKPENFIGMPGETYQLFVVKDNKLYKSVVEKMNPLPPIEYAFISFLADPNEFEIGPEDENYFVSAFVVDDPDEDNYYRWKISVNDVLRNKSEELVLFDDQFTNGNDFKFDASNIVFTSSDEPKLLHMSLSKRAFEYYKLLKNQSDNSSLSPRIQPSILKGNMTNDNDPNELVLGYFGASEVQEVEVRR
jgi:hypothetical protein